jgi:hypothetical protein
MSALALLNTSIITADGAFTLQTVTLHEALELLSEASNVDSAIGHTSTAQILTELLGQEVAVNRQQFRQEIGQSALVFKLKGRPEEGQILTREEIEKIGYELKVLTRQS